MLALCLWAAEDKPVYQEPKEEDESLVQKTEYSFNPLQAQTEFRVGNFYWKKKAYKAAAGRYEEATKWNPTFAEAFFRLGEANMKLAEEEKVETEKETQQKAAREAFHKYLELQPKGKEVKKAEKYLASLEHR